MVLTLDFLREPYQPGLYLPSQRLWFSDRLPKARLTLQQGSQHSKFLTKRRVKFRSIYKYSSFPDQPEARTRSAVGGCPRMADVQ